MKLRALLLGAAAATTTAAALLSACAEDVADGADVAEAGSDGAGRDGTSPGAHDAATADAPSPADAGADARDAAKKDANGPGAPDAECSFNADCQAALRCECDEATGCACLPGSRGTGQSGLDTCDSGNHCESALCVEGPGGVYYCSDECKTGADCTGQLPLCADISLVGRICIRNP